MRTILAVLLAAALAVTAFAHNGVKHIRGTVKAIKANTITVQTTENETVTVTFDAQTKFLKSGVAADVKQLKTGERVAIDAPDEGEAKAMRVQFGPPAKGDAHAGHSNSEGHH